MPPQPTPTGLFPLPKEKKTPGGTSCHVGTPTQTLRRVVKPLGEHNRSRSHSPALDSLSLKDKRTPRAKKAMLPGVGVDLTRRFADSVHGPCSLATNRGSSDVRSPRGSPSLDRIQEGCSSALGRDRKGPGTAFKSRLQSNRGGDDTPPVKKAITFSTPFGKDSNGKDSIRKHEKLAKRKDLTEKFNEKFILEAKKQDMASVAGPLLTAKPFVDRHIVRDVDHFMCKEPSIVQMHQLEGHSKLQVLPDMQMLKGLGMRGKISGGNAVSLTETLAAPRNSMHDIMENLRIGHRSSVTVEENSFAKDAPCRLAFDAMGLSPLGSKSLCGPNLALGNWKDARSGAAATLSPLEDVYGKENFYMSNIVNADECGGDVMLSPLPCNSPEVCSRGLTTDSTSLTWELQEDNVAQEWFRSRDMVVFESYCKGSKTPEPQPSKSPELSRRAIGSGNGVGNLIESAGVDRQEDVLILQTPSPQATSSPEFLKRGSVPPSSGGCFGAGPLMGPEGMRSVKDRRKCKPRGILTIEGEFLSGSGSLDFLDEEEVQIKETISVPALASVEWMVAEGYEVEPVEHRVSRKSRDLSTLGMDAGLKVSPGSFSQLRELGERDSSIGCHRRCRSAAESGSDQVFWKKGLLYEWNLSLSDQKRAESPVPLIEGDADDSPVGKLRDFSPMLTPPSRFSDFTGNSLVIGAFGSVTDTPPSCRASDFAGEDEAEANFGKKLCAVTDRKIDHSNKDLVKGLLPVERLLQELSLDGQGPSLSMSFSVESSPDSCESWQGMHTTESTRWSLASSRGEWGDYLNNNRYKGFDSQFRFHSTKEEYTPAVKVESYNRSVSGEVSPSTLSVGGYSDEGDSVVCTPRSTVTPNYSDCPRIPTCESPDRDSWRKYCSIDKSAKGVAGLLKNSGRISTRSTSPDLVGISISISGAPSLDSSSDDFEVPRYHSYREESHTPLSEREDETPKMPRGRLHLHEADYSPSSLLKADAFSGVSVSGYKSQSC